LYPKVGRAQSVSAEVAFRSVGVISPTLFAMMVLMALTTTVATTPIVRWILRDSPRQEHAFRGQE